MRLHEEKAALELEVQLRAFGASVRPLPGIEADECRLAFIEQIIESLRRVRFLALIRRRPISQDRLNPSAEMFDPLRGALLCKSSGRTDEAFWLVFLSVHCGKHRKDGWRLASALYGGIDGKVWNWERVSSDPKALRRWIDEKQGALRGLRFGNHRKRESLNAWSSRGTGAAIETYVHWIGPPRTHEKMVSEVSAATDGTPASVFEALYESMDSVATFGRTARFDYLTTLSKLGLAAIEPDRPYMVGATGPYAGARLLFYGDAALSSKRNEVDSLCKELGARLKISMDVLEDALCNWQKSPTKFTPFRG